MRVSPSSMWRLTSLSNTLSPMDTLRFSTSSMADSSICFRGLDYSRWALRLALGEALHHPLPPVRGAGESDRRAADDEGHLDVAVRGLILGLHGQDPVWDGAAETVVGCRVQETGAAFGILVGAIVTDYVVGDVLWREAAAPGEEHGYHQQDDKDDCCSGSHLLPPVRCLYPRKPPRTLSLPGQRPQTTGGHRDYV